MGLSLLCTWHPTRLRHSTSVSLPPAPQGDPASRGTGTLRHSISWCVTTAVGVCLQLIHRAVSSFIRLLVAKVQARLHFYGCSSRPPRSPPLPLLNSERTSRGSSLVRLSVRAPSTPTPLSQCAELDRDSDCRSVYAIYP